MSIQKTQVPIARHHDTHGSRTHHLPKRGNFAVTILWKELLNQTNNRAFGHISEVAHQRNRISRFRGPDREGHCPISEELRPCSLGVRHVEMSRDEVWRLFQMLGVGLKIHMRMYRAD